MKWRKVIRWVLGIFVLVIVAGYFFVTSRYFHHYVLTKAVQEAEKATGGKVEISNFSFHLSGPSVDLDHVVVRGTEPVDERPLFEAAHIFVGLDLHALLHGKFHLAEVVLDRPAIRLIINKQGHTNIPKPASAKRHPSAGASSSLHLFTLAIQHFKLNQGQLYFNDRRYRIGADLQDVVAEAKLEPDGKRYDGSISYHQGAVKYNDWNTVNHNLSLHFVAASRGLTIDKLALSTGSSRISLHGDLKNYSNPTFTGTYKALFAMRDLRHILKNPSLPRGEVRSSGSLSYAHMAGRSLMKSLTAEGELQSSELVENLHYFHGPLQSVRGHYRLSEDSLEVHDLHVALLKGQAYATLSIHDLSGNSHSFVRGSFHSLSLDALRRAALQKNAAVAVPVSGSMSGKFKMGWRGRLNNLVVQSDLKVSGSALGNTGASVTQEPAIPVQGQVHLEYRANRDELTLDQTYFQTPYSEVRLNGVLGNNSKLHIAAHTRDLHEVDVLLAGLLHSSSQAPSNFSDSKSLDLRGSASFNGSAEGSFKSPQLMGTLTAKNLQIHATQWESLRTTVSLNASTASLQRGLIRGPAGQGQIKFGGRVTLTNWAFHKSNPIRMHIAISGLPVNVAQQLVGATYPVSGLIVARASLQGTLDRPVGTGQIELQKLKAWKQPVKSIQVEFQSDGKSIKSKLELHAGPGAASGDILYHLQERSYKLKLHAEKVNLSKLEVFQSRDVALRGDMNFSVTGSGTWNSPKLQLAAQIPHLQFRQESIQNVILNAELLNRQVRLKLTSAAAGSSIEADGTLRLQDHYPVNVSLRTGKLALGPLLTSYFTGVPPELHGNAEVHGILKGPLKQPKLLQGQVDIPTLSLAYHAIKLKTQSPLHLVFSNGMISLHAFELAGNGSRLQVRGMIPLSGSSPLDVAVRGDANLKILEMLDENLEASGQLKLDIREQGSWSKHQVTGSISIANGSFYTNQIPTGLDNLNAKFAVRADRLVIEQCSASSGGGQVSASGFISYRPHVAFDVALHAKSVRIRYPQGVRSVLDSNLNLGGTYAKPRLTGRVLIDRLSFTNEFSLTSFASQFSGPSLSPPSKGFTSRLRLNVRIESTQELSLASSKVSIQGSANLRASGTAAKPVIVGRAVMESGEVFFLGQRYEIQRGVIDFSNPSRTEPVVNVLVTTTVDQYDLSISMVGPLDRLRTHYTSDPPLSAADIINLLAFGKTAEASASASHVPTTLGAESLLAKGVTSQLSSRVEKLAGISHLQIDPLLGGNQRNPGARIGIQQRIAGNLLLTYVTDVRSTQNELIQVEYQATPGLSISVTRDENGGIAASFRFHKSF